MDAAVIFSFAYVLLAILSAEIRMAVDGGEGEGDPAAFAADCLFWPATLPMALLANAKRGRGKPAS